MHVPARNIYKCCLTLKHEVGGFKCVCIYFQFTGLYIELDTKSDIFIQLKLVFSSDDFSSDNYGIKFTFPKKTVSNTVITSSISISVP